jgi:hypothetical protein
VVFVRHAAAQIRTPRKRRFLVLAIDLEVRPVTEQTAPPQTNAVTQGDVEEAEARYGRDIYHDFDLNAPVWNDRFYEINDDLVARCPVARSEVGQGYWMVNHQHLIRQIGQDWKTSLASVRET